LRIHARWDNGSDVSGGKITVMEKPSPDYNYLDWPQADLTDASGWTNFVVSSENVEVNSWYVSAVNCSWVTEFTQLASSPSIIWDRVKVTISVDDRIDVGSKVDVRWSAVYEYDRSPFQGDVSFKILDSEVNPPTKVGIYYYAVSSIRDDKYGLTQFEANTSSRIFDAVEILRSGVSNRQASMGSSEWVWFRAFYGYDGVEFTGESSPFGGVNRLFVNGAPMVWSSSARMWKYNVTSADAGELTFSVTGVEEGQYGLTAFVDSVGPQSITWYKPLPEIPIIASPVNVASFLAVLAVTVGVVIVLMRKRV
jgi:hypothetical protein